MTQPSIDWPVLPEGYFFRVKESFFGIYPWVEIRKRRFVGSTKVLATWQTHTKFPTVVEEIEYLAKVLMSHFEEQRKYSREYWAGDSE